jgi:hypothetical protein
VSLEPEKIFSGDYSRDMWEAINSAKSKRDLRRALYFVCCRIQELESRLLCCGKLVEIVEEQEDDE